MAIDEAMRRFLSMRVAGIVNKSEVTVLDLRPSDFSISTFELPLQLPDTSKPRAWPHLSDNVEYDWVESIVNHSTMLVLMGATWIDGSIGPTSMAIRVGGNTKGLYQLNRMYAPLTLARQASESPGKVLETLAPYILERELDGVGGAGVRMSMRCEGYFSEPIIVEPNYIIGIKLGFDHWPKGLDRQFIIFGFSLTPRGLVIA